MSRLRPLLPVLALVVGACAAEDTPAARGKQVYLAQCIACHSRDPASPGSLGPAVQGASRELLEAKVLRGDYPPGYAPKRPTRLMPPQPQLEPDIADLAAFLRR